MNIDEIIVVDANVLTPRVYKNALRIRILTGIQAMLIPFPIISQAFFRYFGPTNILAKLR